MNDPTHDDRTSVEHAVIDALGQRAKKALLVSELVVSLRRARIAKDEMERALAALVGKGTLMLRDHFCADPHLANVDLRVAALVDHARGADAQKVALHEIDRVWNQWLGEYLANHRCG